MVVIFANGEMSGLDWARPYCEQAEAIVAADGGARYVRALGFTPDVVIGDMDSAPPEIPAWAAAGVRVFAHDTKKDETDLELALLYAADRFDGDILVFGALGGRLDQTLANILLLAHPQLAQRSVRLMSEGQRAWLVRTETLVIGEAGDLVSLIPLGGEVRVELTEGLYWALKDEQLDFGPARGVSNVMTTARATIRIAAGSLLCVHTEQAWARQLGANNDV